MKRKIFTLLSLLILGVLMFISCEREEFTEQDALESYEQATKLSDSLQNIRDSLNRIGGIIDYSVNVVDASSASFYNDKSSKNLESTQAVGGALVTVSQHGMTLQDSTDASGIVVFKDLRVGKVNVHVELDGYTDASFIAKIDPEDDPNVNMYYDVLRHSATMVPVFSTTENQATISGVVTLDSDLTNDDVETVGGIEVLANIDTEDSYFEKYLYQLCSDCYDANGKIVQIAYHTSQTMTTTAGDGSFSLEVPATPQGLPIALEISEYATDQTLLLNEQYGKRVTGPQTVRTYFSSDYYPSDIPYVPGAYVEFSAPTGSVAEPPDQQAYATAYVSESGILSIEITDPGYGYTQSPRLKIGPPDNPMGTQAIAEANIVNGKVTSVDITEQGSGYTSTPWVDVQTIDDGDFGTQATADITVTYSVTNISVSSGGDGYEATPNVTIISPTGSDATAQATMAGYVSEVELTNGGSNYVAPPRVTASAPPSGTNEATFTANMSDYNPLHSIIVEDGFITTYETTPDVTITSGTGSGATAIAELATAGEVASIDVTNPGAGYDEAPTVNIIGGGGFGASAYAQIDAGGSITNIVVAEAGQGYTSDPTIEISAPPAGGTQAAGEAVREFDLERIILTNPGNGYNVNYTGTGDNYNNEPTVVIDGVNYTDGSYDITVRPAMDVEGISINNTGYGYETAPTITITSLYGEGSGASATANILFQVDEIEVVTPGSGYYYNDASVVIDPPSDMTGDQAFASATLGDGIVESVEVDNPGDGYTAPPRVIMNGLDPDEEEAVISATVSNGEVTGFTIDNPGMGYPHYNNYSVTIRTYESGAQFNPRVHETAGIVERIEVTSPGAGYEIAPVVEFNNVGTGGTGAEAVASIEGGRVSGISITNPGSGYVLAPDISLVVPNYIETAIGIPDIENGRITGVDFSGWGVDFLTAGKGYDEEPTITFTPQLSGVGSGAAAKAVIQNGGIGDVIMLNQGSGYIARNYPEDSKGFSMILKKNGGSTDNINAIANKKYIRDMYLGTGKRDPRQNDND